MALIRTGRSTARTGRTNLVPGGLACVAAAPRLFFVPIQLQLSATLKFAGSHPTPRPSAA